MRGGGRRREGGGGGGRRRRGGGGSSEIPGAQIVSNNDRECPQHSSRGTLTTDGWMAGEERYTL